MKDLLAKLDALHAKATSTNWSGTPIPEFADGWPAVRAYIAQLEELHKAVVWLKYAQGSGERNEAWGRLETAMEPLGGDNDYPTGYEDEL